MPSLNNPHLYAGARRAALHLARAGVLALAAGVLALLGWSAQRPVSIRASGPYGLVKTYLNPLPDANDEFGNAVAWLPSGDKIAVGARSDLLGGVSAVGAVYILDRDTGNVTQVLSRTGPEANDYLGFSLAVSGTQVLAGAPHDNVASQNKSGAAYLFDAANGSLVQTFNNPSANVNDFFGFSVAVISDTAVLIGAPQYDGPVVNAGRAYACDIASGVCNSAIDIPNPGAHDGAYFGSAVVSLGGYFAVGAPLETFAHGRVYVYTTTTGLLYNSFAPTTTASGDYFGGALAAVNGNVLVGAQNTTLGANNNSGAAYLYRPNGTLLHIFNNPAPETDAFFGQAVSSDGTIILIGAPGASGQSGRAYLYSATGYQLLATLKKDAPSGGDEFGGAVDVLGENFLAGAPHDSQRAASAGALYRFGVKTEWDVYLPVLRK